MLPIDHHLSLPTMVISSPFVLVIFQISAEENSFNDS